MKMRKGEKSEQKKTRDEKEKGTKMRVRFNTTPTRVNTLPLALHTNRVRWRTGGMVVKINSI